MIGVENKLIEPDFLKEDAVDIGHEVVHEVADFEVENIFDFEERALV